MSLVDAVPSVTMDKDQAINEAGRVFRTSMGTLNEVKRRIRAEAEARVEFETKTRREAAARAIHYAWEQGATKAALREVTTKDHHGFQAYLDLGIELARQDAAKEQEAGE